MNIAERVERFIRTYDLIPPGGELTCLVSGGADSTCLWHLLRERGYRVSALHVNHGLRGDDSEADARFCAEQLGAEIVDGRGGTTEAELREIRYSFATDRLRATGHTASDQVETVLYRLVATRSRRALLGMRAREGALIRPLLSFTREQTAKYCRERGLRWREDESNSSDDFARSRVRARLVPALREIHPGAEENVLALLELLRDEAAVLDSLVTDILRGRGEISLHALRELPGALRRLVVQRLADDAAGALVPGAGRRADGVAALSERGTAELDMGGGVRAVAEYGRLRFELDASETPAPPPVRLMIPGAVEFAGREVVCEVCPRALGPGVLDRAALGDELLVRSWRRGDRMRPLGLGGSKSLQDLFTARRIPRRERGAVAVVESGGEIAWVAGVATSDSFKVTAETCETVRLTVRKRNHRHAQACP